MVRAIALDIKMVVIANCHSDTECDDYKRQVELIYRFDDVDSDVDDVVAVVIVDDADKED